MRNGTIGKDVKPLGHYSYLEKTSEDEYNVVLKKRNKPNIEIQKVDSIIVHPRYGIMVYGFAGPSGKQQWFYINTSRSFAGGWNDSVFRNEQIVLIGMEYKDSAQSSQTMWSKLN
jgi:hypothetical protein